MALADLATGAASANPYGAALGALSGALAGSPSSTAKGGPNQAGPVNITVSGFGSRSSGSATATADQSSQPDEDQFAPSSVVGGVASSKWVLPAVIIGGLALVVFALRRR